MAGSSEHSQESERARFRWLFRLVGFAVVLALLVVFVAENFITVDVRLLFWETETRLAWALIIAGALGYVLGILTPYVRRFRSR